MGHQKRKTTTKKTKQKEERELHLRGGTRRHKRGGRRAVDPFIVDEWPTLHRRSMSQSSLDLSLPLSLSLFALSTLPPRKPEKASETTPIGTMAFLLEEDNLLVRVRKGWQYVTVSLVGFSFSFSYFFFLLLLQFRFQSRVVTELVSIATASSVLIS